MRLLTALEAAETPDEVAEAREEVELEALALAVETAEEVALADEEEMAEEEALADALEEAKEVAEEERAEVVAPACSTPRVSFALERGGELHAPKRAGCKCLQTGKGCTRRWRG